MQFKIGAENMNILQLQLHVDRKFKVKTNSYHLQSYTVLLHAFQMHSYKSVVKIMSDTKEIGTITRT